MTDRAERIDVIVEALQRIGPRRDMATRVDAALRRFEDERLERAEEEIFATYPDGGARAALMVFRGESRSSDTTGSER